MVYRKGEPGKAMMDRQRPHQVALPASRCGGGLLLTSRLFCDERRLSLCTRTHSFRRDDTDHSVFCFAERAHAKQFVERFGEDNPAIELREHLRRSSRRGRMANLHESAR